MSKQLLAKCGVFVLIVVNLGAYYIFWPESGSSGTNIEKHDNPGNPLQIAGTANAAQPGETAKPASPPIEQLQAISLPADPAPDGLPAMPDPSAGALPAPVAVAQADDPTIERLKRLKASFNKESNPAPMLPDPQPKTANPPTPPAPLPAAATPTANVAPKSTPTGKSPWMLQWEINDGRTTLTAKLNKRVDFRIVCDGIKMETQDGALVAIGKVAFSGPGLKATCDQLTVSLGSDSLVFEGKAELHVQQGNPTDLAVPTAELKGERFALRLQQTAGNLVPAQAPAQALPNIHSEPLVPAQAPQPPQPPQAPASLNSAPSPFTVPR